MRRLLLALVIFTFFTMFLGGWTRVAAAGLSCPDWPLCHGKLVPPLTYQIMLEYFHRLAVSLVSTTLLIITFLVYTNRERRKLYGKWIGIALVLLVAQIIFGGLTVLKLLRGEIVATHLVLGLCFFGVLLYTCLKAYRQEAPIVAKAEHLPDWRLVRACCAGIILQVILGGIVSSHYAGLACPDFPTCQGLWLPALTGNVALHFIHRVGAVLITLLCLLLLRQLFRAGEKFVFLGTMVLGLLLTQWSLGIGMVLLELPQVMSVAHLATAILIFALLLVIDEQVQASRLY